MRRRNLDAATKSRLAVHLLDPPDPAALALLQARLDPAIRLTLGPLVPADCAVLVAGRPQPTDLAARSALATLIIPWAGLPDSTRQLLTDFPHIAVHNLHHNSLPVAEMAVALLLAATRRLVPADRALRAGDWTMRYAPDPAPLLGGSTALIVGYGAIGQHVARLCAGLQMRVQAIRRTAPVAHHAEAVGVQLYPPAALPDLLGGATALILCVPHTPATTGLIGAAELARLPQPAVLVNISRGPVVDEAALYQALCAGTLYAAGLDVWYNYPADRAAASTTPPSAYPFHELDNVVLSPHRAGHTQATETLRMTHLADLLNAAAAGTPLPNRLDLAQGY